MQDTENPKAPAAREQAPALPATERLQRSLVRILWDRRWVVAVAVVLGVVGGFLYLAKSTPFYTSTARLYVEQAGPRIMKDNEEVRQSGNYLSTQAELMKSTSIVAAAVNRPETSQLRMFAAIDNKVGYVQGAMSAEVGKKDDIISVSFDSPFPEDAAQVVNAVVDSYITYHATQKRSTAAEVLKILQKEKDKRDQEAHDKVQEMLTYKKDNPSIAFEDEKANVTIQRLARLLDAQTTAAVETLEAKAVYEELKAAENDPEQVRRLIAALRVAHGSWSAMDPSEEEGIRLRADAAAYEGKLAGLKLNYTDQSPSVVAVQGSLDVLRKQLADSERSFVKSQLSIAGKQYEWAKDREKRLVEMLNEQQMEAVGLTAKLARYTLLETDVARAQKICDVLDDRIKELSVTEDTGALSITILEVARPGEVATSPNRPKTMAIALVLGLVLGIGMAFVLDMSDQRLRSTDEISAVLGLPVLGVVPALREKERSLIAHTAPRGHAAEAYRTVRTAIYFGVPNGEAKTLLITSPDAGEGKSTLTSNLAVAMAQAGRRVLVIDADFHKPTQHRIFSTGREKGLSSVLTGQEPLEKVVCHTAVDGLDLLPAGPTPPNPAELLNSDAFVKFLAVASGLYDQVIIDSPPVMALTDARIMGAVCKNTILVLRAEKSTRRAAHQSCEALASVGASVLGVVVNAVPHRKDRYYYGGYRYHRYGYRYGYGREVPKNDEDAVSVEGGAK